MNSSGAINQVFTYYRVSTAIQEEKGTYESQKLAVEGYLKEIGFVIKGEFKDLGESGANNERPQLLAMLDRLDEVSGIAIFSLSRITRNYFFGLELDKLFIEKGKILIIAENREICDWKSIEDKETAHFMRSFTHLMNEKQRKEIIKAIKSGIKRYKSEKGYWGRPPKQLPWKKIEEWTAKGLLKTNIARLCEVNINTFYKKLREHYFECIKNGITKESFSSLYNVDGELISKWELENK